MLLERPGGGAERRSSGKYDYWEQKVIALRGDCLLALAWAHREKDGGRALVAYRYTRVPGTRVAICRIDAGQWVNESEVVVWGQEAGDTARHGDPAADIVERPNTLRFGRPSMVKLPDGLILLACWCVQNGASVIRWNALRIDPV